MNAIDLVRIKELAQKATPGNWFATCDSRLKNVINCVTYDRFETRICSFDASRDCENNSAYIAAASPDVVLALIERIERLEKEADWLSENMAKVCNGIAIQCDFCGKGAPNRSCRMVETKDWRQAARNAVEAQ